jgi:hypothetical protein
MLIAAGSHGVAHWRAFVAVDGLNPTQREAMRAMQAVLLYEPWQTSWWTALGFFSLAFALLLMAFGVSQWVLARETDPRTLRRHALRNAVVCGGGTAVTLVLHPLPAGAIVLGVAALLFALAAWPRPFDQ